MNIIKAVKGFWTDRSMFPTVVTFTGGMGAQMISAAIYFSMKNSGQAVYADLTYFDKPENVAIAGKPGDCSHWSWQLDKFGLTQASFKTFPGHNKRDSNILYDGPEKLDLGLQALVQPDIQNYFRLTQGVDEVLPLEFNKGFLCIHVRRGDYVNVASHLVSDSEFINLAGKFAGLIDNLVVISDSPISPDFRNSVSSDFKHVSFQDKTDAFTAHCIMRSARILICSNSQFSLIAALLNPQALVLIPKQWFGENDRHVEAPIHMRSSFQIMG
jgi:hypothetical protein